MYYIRLYTRDLRCFLQGNAFKKKKAIEWELKKKLKGPTSHETASSLKLFVVITPDCLPLFLPESSSLARVLTRTVSFRAHAGKFLSAPECKSFFRSWKLMGVQGARRERQRDGDSQEREARDNGWRQATNGPGAEQREGEWRRARETERGREGEKREKKRRNGMGAAPMRRSEGKRG